MPKIRWSGCHRPSLSQEIWESITGHTILRSNVVYWDRGICVIQLELDDGRVITVYPVDSVDNTDGNTNADLTVVEITKEEHLHASSRCSISCADCQKGSTGHYIGTSKEGK